MGSCTTDMGGGAPASDDGATGEWAEAGWLTTTRWSETLPGECRPLTTLESATEETGGRKWPGICTCGVGAVTPLGGKMVG